MTRPEMTIRPEFSRRVPLSRIGTAGIEQAIEASPDECRALAGRLQLPAVASLTCRFVLSPGQAGQVTAEAELRAEITQICVVSLEPFEATVSERFTLLFMPEGAASVVPEGLEDHDIDPDLPDELTYSDDAIDIGEAASEQLALALDPYPRMPGVGAPPDLDSMLHAGGQGSGEASGEPAAEAPHPFAALARLRGGPPSGNA